MKCDIHLYVMDLEKLGVILPCKIATHKKQILKIAIFQFVSNFVKYVFAKYYLNWLQFVNLLQKEKGWPFLRHGVEKLILQDFSLTVKIRLKTTAL